MTISEQINQPEYYQPQIIAWRDIWQFVAALIAAIFSGFVCEQGWPGSIITLAPALVFGLLILRQSFIGWSRSILLVACLNFISLSAVLIEPGLLNLAIGWVTLSAFAFVQNDGALGNLLNIGKATVSSFFETPMNFLSDARKVKAFRAQNGWRGKIFSLANILLPLTAIIVFGILLIIANPLIEETVLQLSWLDPSTHLLTWMPLISLLSFTVLFSVLKLKPSLNQKSELVSEKFWAAPFFEPIPVIFTLVILNLMFASENILDLRYLWSGTSLPSGMNYAEYVHRGSYTLIVTAILAGALMIFALQPGSQNETSKPLRGLVYLWTLQNLFLVASSAKRTLDYVEVYGMTLWRLSGLIWMGLVAAGLILIVLRVILKRDSLWLLNSNLITAYIVLLICSFSNFSKITANWNVIRSVQHIKPTSIYQTLDIDLDYLADLGASALPAIHKLYVTSNGNKNLLIDYKPASDEISIVANRITAELHKSQSNWRTWTLRGAMLEAQ